MTETVLRKFADRLGSDPTYFAGIIRHYCINENLRDSEIAQLLGITDQMLIRLKLCKTPVPESDDFADRVRAIADFTLADEAVLAAVVRQFYVINRFTAARVERALPAAARDRDEHPQIAEKEREDRT